MRSMQCSEKEASNMGANLFINYGEAVAMILFGIGFSNLLLQKKDLRVEYYGYCDLFVFGRKGLY